MKRRAAHQLVVAYLALFLAAIAARGADDNWITPGAGLWEVPSNWSLGHVPQAASNDNTQIGVSGTYNVTVGSTAANTVPETFTNRDFLVTSFGTGTPTVEFTYTNAATFRVTTASIGFAIGNGIVNWNAPNGILNANFIGVNQLFGGNGSLNVLAGQVTTLDMRMGGAAGRIGSVTVSTNGTLQFTSNLELGSALGGAGFININGGTFLWDNGGWIGEAANATGQVVLAGGSFIQNNNNHQIVIGGVHSSSSVGSVGRMIVSNGNWESTGFVYVGAGDNALGEFLVYGGTLTNISRPFSVGDGASSTGRVLIAGATANWTSRSTWSVGTGANSLGTVTMSNGTFHIIDSNVHIQLGNASGSVGEWNQAGGSMILDNVGGSFAPSFQVGVASGATGTLHVTGGLLEIDGTSGNGLSIGTTAGSTGSAILEGGRVATRVLNVGSGGMLSNRTGGVLQFLGQDSVSGSGAKIVDGGTLSYKDYTALDVNNAASKFNIVSGSGLQLDRSTNVNITGTYLLTNAAGSFKDLSLTGNGPRWQSDSLLVDSTAGFRVTNAVNAHVASTVSNLGVIRVDTSSVTWEKPVVISGSYISDPSTSTFLTNVTVTASGTLVGGPGDVFDFKKSLFIQSTNNLGFNLASSAVSFSGGGDHTNAVAGGDFGTNLTAYPNANFTYGTLTLASATDQLYFVSGGFTNGLAGSNALYVTQLNLFDNGGALQSNLVTSLHSPFNIYYLDSVLNPGNAYLNDQTFSLGGGFLMPFVPEPSAVTLILAASLVWWRGRRR